uniref:Uncharacterized protein n=1 Tax=Escherichia coli TaxID=562 RepID=A0A7L8KAA2_ECOLX|nr:hypothetical protein [Escherichia coli]
MILSLAKRCRSEQGDRVLNRDGCMRCDVTGDMFRHKKTRYGIGLICL